MSLPPLRLDDLTWADLVGRVRQRIPAESGGRWTLHAPVDPGITVLELYAWLLEQRLYLLDQVPDALVRGALDLLGVAGPRPAAPARTVLELRPSGFGAPRVVTAGTELTTPPGAGTRLVLTTDDDVALVPVTGWRVHGAGAVRRDGAVALLPAAGGPGEAVIELDVPGDADPGSGAPLVLLLRLATPARVAPSWAAEAAVDVPPPAEVRWCYADPAGDVHPFAEVVDGTGGLRRSGLVRLPWPQEWRPGPGPEPVARRVVLRVARATFTTPPLLTGLAVDAVPARHRQVRTPDVSEQDGIEDQVNRWLALPGATLALPGAAGRLLDAPTTVTLRLRERDVLEPDGVEHDWQATDRLDVHGPDARVFVVDRAHGLLRFGDGYRGRIPVPHGDCGRPRVAVTYELGGGDPGIGAGVPWDAPARITAVGVTGLDDGREPETVAEARDRAAAELRRPTRAVTAADYDDIARSTAGVAIARTHVAVGLHPNTPCDPVPGAVTVIVVPQLPERADGSDGLLDGTDALVDDPAEQDVPPAPQPDPGLLAAVRRRLAGVRLVGAEVFVRGPRYRQVRLIVDLAAGIADPGRARRLLSAAFADHLHPLTGGPDGTGWPFGAPLRPSELRGVAERAIDGVATVLGVGVVLDAGPAAEFCEDVPIGPHDLVGATEVRIRVRPGPTGPGGLA